MATKVEATPVPNWVELLKASEVFSSLSQDTLDKIAASCVQQEMRRGQYLFEEGEPRKALYIVAHGRLSTWSGRRRIGEVKAGQCLGDLALLKDGTHSTSAQAERDSSLLCLNRSDLEEIFHDNPKELLTLVLGITERLIEQPTRCERAPTRSIAIAPLFEHSEVGRFCLNLQNQLHSRHSSALFPPSDRVPEPSWFDQQEARYNTVLYQCSPELDDWSKRCLRQADRILVLGVAKHPRSLSPLERYWADIPKAPARNMLVLLGSGKRRGTSLWLKERRHLGVHHLNWGQKPDRIARFLDGTALGLVLGGGGARGLAHVGVLQALEERKIEADLVCGTSMGGFVAALHASGRTAKRVESDMRWAWLEAGPFLDFTFPLYSIVKGDRMIGRLHRLFGSAFIEDLPMPFFCMSSDITHACSVVHDHGPLVQWLAVGMSVPGVAPPFPYKGSLLLDGGLLNNLPVSVASGYDCGKILAVNVDPKNQMAINTKDYEGSLAQQLWRKLRGKTTAPHIFEILVRVTTLTNAASVAKLGDSIDHYIQPETGPYGLFDFHKADDIIAAGYQAGMAYRF